MRYQTFESVETELRSMDVNVVIDIMKEASVNQDKFVSNLIASIEKKEGRKKAKLSETAETGNLVVEYKIESTITEWDDGTFDDCYGDEITDAEDIEEKPAKSLDCSGRLMAQNDKGVKNNMANISKANAAGKELMTKLLQMLKKGNFQLTFSGKDDGKSNEGIENKKEMKDFDVSGIPVTEVVGEGGKLTLKANVNMICDGVGADLSTVRFSMILYVFTSLYILATIL